MMKIVATNVVASRPPNGRPTGTPTARANCCFLVCWLKSLFTRFFGLTHSSHTFHHIAVTTFLPALPWPDCRWSWSGSPWRLPGPPRCPGWLMGWPARLWSFLGGARQLCSRTISMSIFQDIWLPYLWQRSYGYLNWQVWKICQILKFRNWFTLFRKVVFQEIFANTDSIFQNPKFSRKQAKLGVPHSKSKLSWPNQIHLASWNLPDF